jgi:hypothetical protein
VVLQAELLQFIQNLTETGEPLDKILLLANMLTYYTPITTKDAEHVAELQHLMILLVKQP